MPSKASRPKSTSVSRGSKRKAGNISSSNTTPVRQSGRVKKTVVTPSKRPSKKKRTDSSEEDNSEADSDPESASDFEVEDPDLVEENGKTEEDDDDNDDPQSYSIPLPKARDAGDQPYEDGRIHPNTFLFLKDLKVNNNREWLKCQYNYACS
jgi:hypothetical protein